MQIASTNSIAKVAAVLAMVGLVASSFAAFAPAAGAQTTTTSASASVTFTRDLTVGSTGADVTALQNWLISKGFAISAGATGYFGAQTKAALAAYQAANGISPAAGYFGPITRAKVMAGGSTTGGTGTGSGTGSTGGLSGGEASLEDLNGQDGEDDGVDEGGTAQVAEFEFDVEDGDVRIDRLDLGFYTSAATGEEDEPWETFDTITIYNADGDELASEDVSDEDEWLEDDEPYVFRFTDLDYMIEEGEMGTLIVEVEAQDGIDGVDTGITWTVFVEEDGIRGTDGEGIEQYLGEDDNTENQLDEEVTFDIDEEGSDDDLSVRSSSEDPEATTLQVETNGRSDWYTVFAFELDSDEDSGEIEINELPINFTTSDNNVDDVINDVELVIDGETFDDYDWVSPTGTTASTTFNIDGDYAIEGGETVTVEVMVEFKAATAYSEGTTIALDVDGAFIDAEGADDITVDGSATGDTHALRSSGVDVSSDSDSATTQVVDGSDNDYATFTLEVEVMAFEQDVFISKNAGTAFTYQIEDSNGNVIGTSTATSSSISSDADEEGNYFRVDEGSSETFTFQVTYNPLAANEGAFYRMQLLTIAYNDTAASPDTTYTATPANEFETNSTVIND